MRELEKIVTAARSALAAGTPAAMATILAARGSSFRRPGARLWIGGGRREGSISAGCLENDLAERARPVLERSVATLTRYDTANDQDILWGTASGCGGELTVLIEPVTSALVEDLEWVVAEGSVRRACALATNWDGTRVARHRLPEGTQSPESPLAEQGRLALEEGANRILHDQEGAITLIETHRPPISLTVFGSGEDAVNVARCGASLGWITALVTRKAAQGALDGITLIAGDEPEGNVEVDERSAVVLMTHDFYRDASLLATFLARRPAYLGVLGPARRTRELLGSTGMSPNIPESVHAPAGLDLGGETPREIAISVVAEIQAHFAGRHGGKLRETSGPIHAPSAQVERALAR